MSKSRRVGTDTCVMRAVLEALAPVAVAGIVLSVATVAVAQEAQETNVIRGEVREGEQGAVLEGALVELQSTGARTYTERGGRFELRDVPAGPQTIIVSYLGYATQTFSVDAGDTEARLVLGGESESGTITVVGRIDDRSRRLNLERSEDALTNVVSSDLAGQFPDRNISEVLRRAPGIVSRSIGSSEEGSIFIRGVGGGGLNSALVDGVRMPSTITLSDAGGRSSNIRDLSAAVFERLEIRKVFTPDMTANWAGGAVDVITRTAFDQRSGQGGVSVEVGENELREGQAQYQVTGNYSLLSADQRWGLLGSFSFEDRNISSERGLVESYGNSFAGFDAPTLYTENDFDLDLTRAGVVLDLGFRPNAADEFHLAANIYRTDLESLTTIDAIGLAYQAALPPLPGSTAVSGTAQGGQVQKRASGSEAQTDVLIARFRGRHDAANWDWSYGLAYSNADYLNEGQGELTYASSIAPGRRMSWDFTDPSRPLFSSSFSPFTPGVSANDVSANYTQYTVSLLEDEISDSEWSGNFSIARDLHLSLSDVRLEAGALWSDRSRDRDRSAEHFQGLISARPGIALSNYAVENFRPEFINGLYEFGVGIDLPSAMQFFDANHALFAAGNSAAILAQSARDSLAADYSADERLGAVYGMFKVTSGSVQIIGGVRYENVETTLTGNQVTTAGAIVTSVPVQTEFGHEQVFPSLVARWEPFRNVLVRAGFSATYVLPNLTDLAPIVQINNGPPATIRRGNPNLEPLEATNFDLSAHWYGEYSAAGMAVFHKDLSGFVFNFTQPETIDAITYQVTQPENASTGFVRGVEFEASTRFHTLPGILSNLGVEANLSLTESELVLPTQANRVVPIAGTADITGNLSLIYETERLSARLSYRYQSEIMDTIGSNVLTDGYLDERENLDFTLSARLTRATALFFQVRNLTEENQLEAFYGADVRRERGLEYSGRYMSLALRHRF